MFPEIEGGRYAIKRTLGEQICVEADVFADRADLLCAVLKYRHESVPTWTEVPMRNINEDRWSGSFRVTNLGTYFYTVKAWPSAFRSWAHRIQGKAEVAVDLSSELAEFGLLLQQAAASASRPDAECLSHWAELCQSGPGLPSEFNDESIRADIDRLLARYGRCGTAADYNALRVTVDPVLARFGAWYQLFPRSCATQPKAHGTLGDLERLLPRLADMSFDVVYLPPIHPIGRSGRKGRNNSLTAHAGEPGSPWAIGASEGGHKSVHPELGTLDDFRALVARARQLKLEIALDVALQCSPDHPYVTQHPEWFRRRPDGTIQCAESPPYRYEDVFPFDFDCVAWRPLWDELKSIFVFWIEQGVRVFRVDNPHTKPFAFWEWLLAELKRQWPELIFLSEGLTRPNPMIHLARVGFSQSYDYFPWRTAKAELTDYYTSLNHSDLKEFLRPSLWPNTPQLLPPILQHGGRPAFMMRVILAATLGATYGIYGPAYELCEDRATGPNSVAYLNSEQYELKCWNWDTPDNLSTLVTRLNQIRRANPALHGNSRLRFQTLANEHIIAYSKTDEHKTNRILTVVNLDPQHTQSGWTSLDLAELNLPSGGAYTAQDLLTGTKYLWEGNRNYVRLDPQLCPAHVFLLECA